MASEYSTSLLECEFQLYPSLHSAGIGFTAIKHLAKRGAKVYLGARSEEKAKAAIERLTAEGIGSGQVHHLNLDLSDPKLAKAVAEDFLTKEIRLDVLGMLRRETTTLTGMMLTFERIGPSE